MKYLKNRHLFKMYEYVQPFINYSVPREKVIYGDKVLVIAPHQDDEAIGCAGTLIKHVQNGGRVEVIFCTHDTSERMEESKKATLIIGSFKNYYMQFSIRNLYNNKEFKYSLFSLINKIAPDVIFLPFWFDKHEDHRAVSVVLMDIKKEINLNFMIYSYSIWTTLNPNCLFDISDVWKLKKKAIECYKTQIITRDYVKIARGLNQYWGEIKTPPMQYAETFFRATVKEYIDLGRKIFK
ncbi:MAG: PIG-L family deacetylase [Endomicrobium sp.]|jgi:LmbE family N-acetylglucosaminyl deacetylase|nr:PIG-L family deacetylase [Endomicrobium sp.]